MCTYVEFRISMWILCLNDSRCRQIGQGLTACLCTAMPIHTLQWSLNDMLIMSKIIQWFIHEDEISIGYESTFTMRCLIEVNIANRAQRDIEINFYSNKTYISRCRCRHHHHNHHHYHHHHYHYQHHHNPTRYNNTAFTWWRHNTEAFFRITGPFHGESTGHQWEPLT